MNRRFCFSFSARVTRLIIICTSIVTLANCSQLAIESANQMKKLSDAISKSLTESIAPTNSKPEEPLYCYKTLGTPDCYDKPLPGQQDRLIAYYGPRMTPDGEVIVVPPPQPEQGTVLPPGTPPPVPLTPQTAPAAAPTPMIPGFIGEEKVVPPPPPPSKPLPKVEDKSKAAPTLKPKPKAKKPVPPKPVAQPAPPPAQSSPAPLTPSAVPDISAPTPTTPPPASPSSAPKLQF